MIAIDLTSSAQQNQARTARQARGHVLRLVRENYDQDHYLRVFHAGGRQVCCLAVPILVMRQS